MAEKGKGREWTVTGNFDADGARLGWPGSYSSGRIGRVPSFVLRDYQSCFGEICSLCSIGRLVSMGIDGDIRILTFTIAILGRWGCTITPWGILGILG